MDELLYRVICVHGRPCYCLLELGLDDIKVVSVASNLTAIGITLDAKDKAEKMNYFG